MGSKITIDGERYTVPTMSEDELTGLIQDAAKKGQPATIPVDDGIESGVVLVNVREVRSILVTSDEMPEAESTDSDHFGL